VNSSRFAATALAVGALALATGDIALAEEGGIPNENATFQTGKGDPPGRKADCSVPGDAFSGFAQLPGPNNNYPGRDQTLGEVVGTCISEPKP
jgi:hypothetical protein